MRYKDGNLPVVRKTASVVLAIILALSVISCGESREAVAPAPSAIERDGAVVSYLGPRGTYTQEACERFFGEGPELVPFETVPDAVTALAEGDSNYAVIPVENTIGGAVTDYIDTLISNRSVSVVGEVELPINQNLLVLPGTVLSDIRKVYSHKQGIAQGKEWLSVNLPEAEVIEVSSTAEGARRVSEEQDRSCAAIASAGCADVYGLEILAPAIQNNGNNVTRFYVLTNGEAGIYGSGRTAFIAGGTADDMAVLAAELKKQGVTLIAVHDRPLKTQLGQYSFLVECSYISGDTFARVTGNSSMSIRNLGSFDVK